MHLIRQAGQRRRITDIGTSSLPGGLAAARGHHPCRRRRTGDALRSAILQDRRSTVKSFISNPASSACPVRRRSGPERPQTGMLTGIPVIPSDQRPCHPERSEGSAAAAAIPDRIGDQATGSVQRGSRCPPCLLSSLQSHLPRSEQSCGASLP